MNITIAKIGILFFLLCLFIQGFGKIIDFQKKTKGLSKKTGLPYPINELGMIGVDNSRNNRCFNHSVIFWTLK